MNSYEFVETHRVLNVKFHIVEPDLADGRVALVDGELFGQNDRVKLN